VEGVQAINRAIAYHWAIDAFIYGPEADLSDWAISILQESPAKVHYQLHPALMEQLSDKENTSELLALVSIPVDDLSRIPITENFLGIILDRPTSPGNLGTIIRSCDSFSANGMVITGHSADLYDPQTIRASIGSIFTLPSVRAASYKDLIPWFAQIKKRYPNFQVIGSSAKATTDILEVDFTRPTAFVLGNETSGLSWNLRTLCDDLVRIPIYGSASSLNIACAASIFLYESNQQRRRK